MKLLTIKTARFSKVVEECGVPKIHTPWRRPSDDREFQTQLKNSRVMTVLKTERGTDFGSAGFRETKDGRYLIFPKSLKRFANRRIVGIDWELVRP
jgi:hypothetical protein